MIYSELTSPEIGKIAPDAIALLPLAAVEQHGHHLPVVTDTALVGEVARRVEAALPDVVALCPILWPGNSHHHLAFPGTLSISSDTYVRVLEDLVGCLISAGFRHIFLLNGHGGNVVSITEALNRIGLKRQDVCIAAQSYWELAGQALADQDFMESPRLTHACEYETSMMLALREDWVKMDKAKGSRAEHPSKFYDPLGYDRSIVMVGDPFDRKTPNGAMGSPELATPEKGRQLFDLVSDAAVEFLDEFRTWKPSPLYRKETTL